MNEYEMNVLFKLILYVTVKKKEKNYVILCENKQKIIIE